MSLINVQPECFTKCSTTMFSLPSSRLSIILNLFTHYPPSDLLSNSWILHSCHINFQCHCFQPQRLVFWCILNGLITILQTFNIKTLTHLAGQVCSLSSQPSLNNSFQSPLLKMFLSYVNYHLMPLLKPVNTQLALPFSTSIIILNNTIIAVFINILLLHFSLSCFLFLHEGCQRDTHSLIIWLTSYIILIDTSWSRYMRNQLSRRLIIKSEVCVPVYNTDHLPTDLYLLLIYIIV